MQIINKSPVKLAVKNQEEYNILFNHFKSEKINFHIFQYRENKINKCMIGGLPTDYSIEEIKSSLNSQGLSIISVTQIRHFITKAPLPLFLFEANANLNIAKKLEKITSINNLII